jgi:hypothetical protein
MINFFYEFSFDTDAFDEMNRITAAQLEDLQTHLSLSELFQLVYLQEHNPHQFFQLSIRGMTSMNSDQYNCAKNRVFLGMSVL